MLRIAIVDDHAIVRAGFRELLGEEIDLTIAFEAASGEAALEALKGQGQNGVDVLRTIRQRYPQVGVLVLSGFPEERYALPMIRQGAHGYLCKDCERDDLLRAIHTVSQGRRYVSPRTAELLAGEMLDGVAGLPHESLSEREMQVFVRLANGATVSDIADKLNLSVKTISTYRARLLEKLGLGSNAELATYAMRNGLLME